MSEWWAHIAPAEAVVACGEESHRLRWESGELRALDHADPEGERALAALAGTGCPCLDLVDAWARHEDDVRVLVVASRGSGDELAVTEDAVASLSAGLGHAVPQGLPGRRPPRGWWSSAGSRAGVASMQRIVTAGRGPRSPRISAAERAVGELAALLSLGGGVPDRLAAMVVSHWHDRLARGERGVGRVRPQLEAELYGRVLAAVSPWLGSSLGELQVTMVADRRRPRLERADDGTVRAALPFRWLLDVHAQGLAVIWGRFCLSAESDDGRTWRLSTVGPDLGPPEMVTLTLS